MWHWPHLITLLNILSLFSNLHLFFILKKMELLSKLWLYRHVRGFYLVTYSDNFITFLFPRLFLIRIYNILWAQSIATYVFIAFCSNSHKRKWGAYLYKMFSILSNLDHPRPILIGWSSLMADGIGIWNVCIWALRN